MAYKRQPAFPETTVCSRSQSHDLEYRMIILNDKNERMILGEEYYLISSEKDVVISVIPVILKFPKLLSGRRFSLASWMKEGHFMFAGSSEPLVPLCCE